jgi:signal peptidase I
LETIPIQDQLANVSPVWVVLIVMGLTLVRLALAKIKDPWARTVSETCDTINFVLILAFLVIRPFVAQAFYIPSESMERTLLVGDRLIVNKFGYRLTEPKRGDVIVFEAPPTATGGKSGVDFIKRLIALPGDTVLVKKAQLTLNGENIDPHPEGDLHSYLRSRLGLKDGDAVKIYPDYLLINGTEKITKERVAEMLGQPGASITMTPGQAFVNGKPLDESYTREDPDYDYPEVGDGSPLRLEENQLFVMGDNRNHSADSHAWGTLERHRIVGKAVFVFYPFTRIGQIR